MSLGPVNVDDIDWTDYDHGKRAFRRKQLAPPAGGEDIGASLYDVAPGKRLWLRHYHEGNEEAMFVREGSGTLWLGPDAEAHALEPGDYVALPAGEESAHEIEAGDEGLRLLMVSTMAEPDITVYPDKDMVGLYAGAAPGGDSDERSISTYLDLHAEMAYWEE
ncbi:MULTISPECIES: cupin domain-containing protein [Haloarcula]|uniref:Cupin n=1 Tax=Haloarcula pellucida TaxID=1427151 RepID=A0A830GKC7_9EURY|nr:MULTISPECIES: cupin domain-containing protein [Halomicroarcula]MBX0347679.1 cupin domain-containing protein [Halomicroarcula pellucida]MDS0276388.1 cupin domain-containing protein [Halomicroarcula sp. S1AR25-4]QIO23171.1 cupin domain-containing protein [Haloarcula sp. JP-L23]GGN89827.1 cupin [Halomicroarcula pellucida]